MRKFMSVYTPIDISHIYNLKVKENYYIKFLSVLQKNVSQKCTYVQPAIFDLKKRIFFIVSYEPYSSFCDY